jgi:hypothetical protein
MATKDNAAIHWYEANDIGKPGFKIKRYLDI